MCSHEMPTSKSTKQGHHGNEMQGQCESGVRTHGPRGHPGRWEQPAEASQGARTEHSSQKRGVSRVRVVRSQGWCRLIQERGSVPALGKVVEKALVQESKDLNVSPSNATELLTGPGQAALPAPVVSPVKPGRAPMLLSIASLTQETWALNYYLLNE